MLKLKELRKSKNITMKKLGEKIGVAESTISLYENGKRQPDYDTLTKIADFFGVSVDELLGRVPTTDTSSPLDAELEGIDFALYGEVKELTDDEKEDVLKFIQFTKSKRTDANDD